jgi:hypothetical protein
MINPIAKLNIGAIIQLETVIKKGLMETNLDL